MPLGFINTLSFTKKLLSEMYSVAKNASPELRLGRAFLATLFISEKNCDTASLNKS